MCYKLYSLEIIFITQYDFPLSSKDKSILRTDSFASTYFLKVV